MFEMIGRMTRVTKPQFMVLMICAIAIGACSGQRKMMPTPNVYVDSGPGLYEDLDPSLQTTQVPLFYITDRVPEHDENGNLNYGYGRSASLAFGKALVDVGDDLSWEELKQASRLRERPRKVNLELMEVEEIARGPNAPIPFKEVDGQIIELPEYVRKRGLAIAKMQQAIVRQLALTPRKEVFLFVHGYHNTFNDAAFIVAEMWHFLGRFGVPLAYSWPAGHPGLFGYTYDRESSEFTVYHLRQILTLISNIPEVEKIHLIGHSRGTGVVVNALRELTIAARAKELDPKVVYKIHNLVLAAPDIDTQVATQRILGDKLALSAYRFTVYTSPKDKAIGLSTTLFDSPRGRIGRLGNENLPETMKAAMEYGKANLAVIKFSGNKEEGADSLDHSYFRKVPTVSSDLIIMLREDADAGSPERPLTSLGTKFWEIPKGYPVRSAGQ